MQPLYCVSVLEQCQQHWPLNPPLDCLCRLLRAAGTPNVPNFSTKGCQEFTSRSKHWWGTFTKCISFGTQSARSKRRFYDEVQTDGVSVSVTMFKPDPPSSLVRLHAFLGWTLAERPFSQLLSTASQRQTA